MFKLSKKPGLINSSRLSKLIKGILSDLFFEDAVIPNLAGRKDINLDHYWTLGPKPLLAEIFFELPL